LEIFHWKEKLFRTNHRKYEKLYNFYTAYFFDEFAKAQIFSRLNLMEAVNATKATHTRAQKRHLTLREPR